MHEISKSPLATVALVAGHAIVVIGSNSLNWSRKNPGVNPIKAASDVMLGQGVSTGLAKGTRGLHQLN